MEISVYTDGGARGNPGPAGYGFVVYDSSRRSLYQESKFIGIKTNNEAEYLAFAAALNWICDNQLPLQISQITFYSDSELLVRQVTGQYKVKAKNLKPIFAIVKSLLDRISLPFSFLAVPRSQNYLADKLANQAMDQKS